MDILSALLTWQFVLFCLAVYAVTFVIRTVVEYIIKLYTKQSVLWNDVILPILPVMLGSLMGWLIVSFPYPENLSSRGFRVVFGLVAGLLSTLVYRILKVIVKAFLAKKIVETNPSAQVDEKKLEDVVADEKTPGDSAEELSKQIRETISPKE